MPLVSVIMNIKNGAPFLKEAIDSVLLQTFSDWELIAWDDCSTDKSPDIVAGYKDPRIRYFRSAAETTLAKARQNAIQQAQGEWLAFLDQDDIWTPGKLQQQVALAGPRVGIIYGRAVLFWPDGTRRDYDQAHEYSTLPEGNIFAELFRSACFIAMSSAMVRRPALLEAGILPAYVDVAPDYYFYVAVAKSYQARAVQDVVCWYRMHPSNSWQASRSKLHYEAIALIDAWSNELPPEVAKYRRSTHATALALDDLRNVNVGPGMKQLWNEGSLTWLLERPFVHLARRLRRKIQRPRWQQSSSAPPGGGNLL